MVSIPGAFPDEENASFEGLTDGGPEASQLALALPQWLFTP